MYFSCFGKKSTKRSHHRRGTNAALPRVKYVLSYVPLPWRTDDAAKCCPVSTRQGENRNIFAFGLVLELKVSGGSLRGSA